jgi:hypothetical protein
MADTICLECGAEIPYDWAPCPQCGWKAPDAWEMEEETNRNLNDPPGFLSKPRSWIVSTVWILLGVLFLGLVLTFWRHS